MISTEQIYKNNNNYEGEIDNSSETSKDYSSSNISFVDDAKKRNGLNNEKNKDKRNKRNSFIQIFKKDDKEKEEKEKSGLTRSLSGIFSKDKDNKSNDTVESEKLRPTSRTSSNGDTSKNRRSFIFSDDDDKLDVDTTKKGRKSRQSSITDGVDKDKSTKLGNRISVNLGKFFDNKPSHKSNTSWDDNFLEPDETIISPKSPTFKSESLKNINSITGTGINGVNKPTGNFSSGNRQVNTDESPIDDSRSTNSSTQLSSVDEYDVDTTGKRRKSRQNSDAGSRTSSDAGKSTKLGNRVSVNLGKFFDNKPSHKSNPWEDNFLEPVETSEKNPSYKSKPTFNTIPEYVESPKNNISITGIEISSRNSQVINDESLIDDTQSTNSSTQQSSIDDQYEIRKPESSESDTPITPVTPMTPKLIVTTEHHNPTEPGFAESTDFNYKRNGKQEVEQKNVTKEFETKKSRNVDSLVISTNVKSINNKEETATNLEQRQQNNTNASNFNPSQNETNVSIDEVSKKLRELEEIRKQLEAKTIEQNAQNSKYNSMEQIMQQQIDLSKCITETIHRLESKVNVQKDEFDNTDVSKMFENTIKRLEDKIDQQSEELNDLKSIVGQLSGGTPQKLLTRAAHDENQNLIMAPHGRGDQPSRALIQTHHLQPPQIYPRNTLVNTLVVNPLYNTITISAGIAASVVYAVYVRPVIGFFSILRKCNQST